LLKERASSSNPWQLVPFRIESPAFFLKSLPRARLNAIESRESSYRIDRRVPPRVAQLYIYFYLLRVASRVRVLCVHTYINGVYVYTRIDTYVYKYSISVIKARGKCHYLGVL